MSTTESYSEAWRKRFGKERAADARATKKAFAIAQRLAQVLRDPYGATRVILCGSLARGDFHTDSDIDLAVEGLAPELFFQAGAQLEREAGDIVVDLVPLESANPAYRERALCEGLVLHDAR